MASQAGKSLISRLFDGIMSPVGTGRVNENILAIQTTYVNCFLFSAGGETLLIDTGTRASLLRSGLEDLGVAPETIGHVFLTHGDLDHTGGLELCRNAQLYLSRDEVPMIDGRKKRFPFYRNPPITRPINLLDDGEEVDLGPLRVKAIATPGHTPGSLCYLVNGQVLFSGDNIRIWRGKFIRNAAFMNMDNRTYKASFIKVLGLKDISLLCTSHFGIHEDFEGGARR